VTVATATRAIATTATATTATIRAVMLPSGTKGNGCGSYGKG